MMRVVWLVLIAILLPAAVCAGPWNAGLRAGLSLSNIHGGLADVADPKYKSGFVGGGLLEFFPGPVGLGVELNYIQKGFKTKGYRTDDAGNVIGQDDATLDLTYLEVPVLVRAALPQRGPMQIYGIAGPSFGFALEAREEFTGGGHRDLSDDLENMDLGATFGLGARFGNGPYRVGMETRYTTGFSDLWDISDNIESINHAFDLTLSLIR